jgi:hypothetical protein
MVKNKKLVMSAHSIYKCLLSCVALYGAGIFLPKKAEAHTCSITITTTLPAKRVTLSGCEFAGNLKKTGPHFLGRFVLDLDRLTSSVDLFDKNMKNYFRDRYATLSIIPFDRGDESFKALLKLNDVSRFVKINVAEIDNYNLKTNFKVDLRDFNFSGGYGWDLIRPIINIKAEVSHVRKDQRIPRQP